MQKQLEEVINLSKIMFGLLKNVEISSTNKNQVIHSLHKSKSSFNLNISLDKFKDQDSLNRCSIASGIKTDSRSIIKTQGNENKQNIKYMSYPFIFKNKTLNIQKILRNKKKSDHLEKIVREQKQNKFSLLISQKNQYHNDYYNFDYLFSSNHPKQKTIRQSFQSKISCKGLHYPSKIIEINLSKQKLSSKRKQNQRNTQKFQKLIKRGNMRTSHYFRDNDINLSPWGQTNDHLQN